MRYIIALALVLLGVLEIMKTEWLLQNFGRIQWAEEKLGGDGTRTFHKILGIGWILLGFIIASGQVYDILDWIFIR